MIKQLTKQHRKKLRKIHKSCKDKRHADRIKAVLLRDKGYSFGEIANILLLDDSTIRNYTNDYETYGVEALLHDNWKGGKGKLIKEQEIELKDHIDENFYLTTKEIIHYVINKYGVQYKERGMNNLLHRIGFVYKKPKQVPGKADQEKQKVFIKEYRILKEAKEKEDKIWFLDGVHPRHNMIPSHGWILKGKEKKLKSNTGRKGLNINGALNIEDMMVTVREDHRINAESTINLIKQIEKKQPKGNIYLIADNARYNYAKLVREYIDKRKRIEIIYLPPYSPNLNIIERLWKFYKKEILYGQYYVTFEEFVQKTRDFFATATTKYNKELNTLLTYNFQNIFA